MFERFELRGLGRIDVGVAPGADVVADALEEGPQVHLTGCLGHVDRCEDLSKRYRSLAMAIATH